MSARLRKPLAVGGGWSFVLVAMVVLVVIGPLLAPYSPDESFTTPFAAPGDGFLLGTDSVGRDVLSRVLYGGRSVLVMAFVATALCYLVGVPLGLVGGYLRGRSDAVIMRLLDVVLAFPPVLLVLVLASTRGTGASTVVVAVALAQVPVVARLVRSAALEVSVRGFVEAERTRGESVVTILWRDILPSISGTLAADVGVRAVLSVLFIASANFLGIGLQPPASDWGLMIAENRPGLEANALAVVAPIVCIAVLTISTSMIADRVARQVGRSRSGESDAAVRRWGLRRLLGSRAAT